MAAWDRTRICYMMSATRKITTVSIHRGISQEFSVIKSTSVLLLHNILILHESPLPKSWQPLTKKITLKYSMDLRSYATEASAVTSIRLLDPLEVTFFGSIWFLLHIWKLCPMLTYNLQFGSSGATGFMLISS